MTSPTHYCVICAARWIKWPTGAWSVLTDCGPCCNNVAMDKAPIVEMLPDGCVSGEAAMVARAYRTAERRAQIERYRGIQCVMCDAPFEKHNADWSCPHRVRLRFKFPSGTLAFRAGWQAAVDAMFSPDTSVPMGVDEALAAQGMSASGRDRNGHEAKPASPVAESDAP